MPENTHDSFFRESFAEPALAAEFFRHYLPPPLAAALDLDRVEVLKDSFVDEELRAHLSDLLCRVRVKAGGELFIYILLEHKSRPARWVALQLLRYMVKIWQQTPQRRGQRLPVIFPLVFYHGKQRWRVPRRFSALFDERAWESAKGYVPEFEYFLCDLSALSRTPIKGAVELQATLLALRGVFDERTADWLAELIRLLFFEPEKRELLEKIARYLGRSGRVTGREIKQVLQQVEEEQMKPAELEQKFWEDFFGKEYIAEKEERGLQRGLEKGLEKGFEEGREEARQSFAQLLVEMLNQKLGPLSASVQARIRRLSLKQLEQLGKTVLSFDSKQDLAAWIKKHTA